MNKFIPGLFNFIELKVRHKGIKCLRCRGLINVGTLYLRTFAKLK